MKNIYLVGFMGTGKTETGRILARALGLRFVDMDEELAASEKMPISEIFKTKGEPYFRQVERELVAKLAPQEGLVVACGGGAFTFEENIRRMKESGVVVCLTSRPETILRRTAGNADRPLLNVKDPKARIEELLKKRAPYYGQAHVTIDADQMTVQEAAEEVRKCLPKN